MANRPNLLFIMTDHQRADSVGMVQAGVEVAPHLNRLAASGAHFSRAYTTCPLCVPARTALATGLYPTRNGVVFNDWKGETAGDHVPLHEVLHRVGYSVAHVGVDHIRLSPPLRQRVPFATWESDPEYKAYKESRGLDESGLQSDLFKHTVRERQGEAMHEVRYSNTRTAVWPHPAEDFKDCFFGRKAIEFLEGLWEKHSGNTGENRSGEAAVSSGLQPFALFLYLWAPHPPLIVPEPYASMFDPARIDLPANVGRRSEGEPAGRRRGIAAQMAEGVSLEQWRKVWAAHLGLVRMADDVLGRVLETLGALGERENTIVVFTSDHGEHLGQHNLYQKMEMHEQALRVPLVVAGPRIRPLRCGTPVSHLDLMPTVLELLGLEHPSALDGISLAPALAGDAAVPDRPIFAQYSGNPSLGDIRRCVIRGNQKYIFDPRDKAELFDLAEDPEEMRNLADLPEHQALLGELHELCARWGREHGDKAFEW